jgi:signal transduction histidine kinase/CheY-like chemotaxis protein/PAS domain-containing protein
MKLDITEIGSLEFLSGGGEMGELIRCHDWSATPLGHPASWPQSLRSAVSICLHSSFPTAIYWGDELCLIYNDAWAPIPAQKHPSTLGRPAKEVWANIWHVVGPQMETVIANAEGFSVYDQMLPMDRGAVVQETYWNYSFTPIRGENGRVAGILNQGHEVTDRILGERRRAEELTRQRRMFEQAPGFITILSGPDHRFEFVNQAYIQLFGDREFIGKTIYEAFPELAGQGYYEWLDRVYRSGTRLVQQGTPIRLEHPGSSTEQRYLDFIYEPLLDESGAVSGIFCEGYDVTEAYLSRAALEASAAALREETHTLETLNRVNAALAGDLDLKRLVQTVTDAGREMTGARFGAYFHNVAGDNFDLFTLSGAHASDFAHLPPPRATPVFAPTFLNQGVVRSDDILADPRYGKASPYHGLPAGHLPVRSYLAVSVVSRSGEVLGGLFYGHPEPQRFTQRHEKLMSALASQAAIAIDNARLFQEVQRTNETLEQRVEARSQELALAHAALQQAQKMEAVGQLTGGIAHDFNNLLAGIIGSLEMIERRVGQGQLSDLGRYVGAARDSASRAAVLTQRLLAFSRRQTLDPKPTDVNRLVVGVEQLISTTIGPSFNLKVVTDADLWLTRIDASQLESALVNLAINARDAMPDGGEIIIETSNLGSSSVDHVNAQLPEGEFVKISVKDAGTGIAPDILDRIFEPFFTTKPIGQGTGLGLSMIHGFVNQSGGRVHAESALGVGTNISLYLPRYSGMVEMTASALQEKTQHTGSETVLLIDDEPNVRMLMTDALAEQGYAVKAAVDGASGIRLLETLDSVDVLVTDVGLPGGMNGRQVADMARFMFPNLKVLFVTGYAEKAALDAGHLEQGMAVLVKPFTMSGLTTKVREMLDEATSTSRGQRLEAGGTGITVQNTAVQNRAGEE